MFCDRLSGQLAAQEEKRKRKKTGQLNGDGLPRLLTGDEFYNRVVEHQNACEAEKVAQEDRRKRKDEQSELLTEWRKAETERKKRNNARREAYRGAMRLWKEESEVAKRERRRVAWAKPKLGKMEPQAPKPGSERGEGASGECEGLGDEGNDEDVTDEQSDGNADGMDGESAEE
ncbi:hypothetical protein BU15DRAFT_48011 [Melanogaster broomeanus]|nr:hypothetical protein BU15DRAFT_48011 [Melanogaster broomeanus]